MDCCSGVFCPYASDCPHLPSVKCTCYLLESVRYLTTNPRYLAPKYRNFLTSSICLPYTTLLSLSLACSILSVLHFSVFRFNLILATSSVNLTVFLRKSLNFYHTYLMLSANPAALVVSYNFTVSFFPCLLFSSQEGYESCYHTTVFYPDLPAHQRYSNILAIILTSLQGIPYFPMTFCNLNYSITVKCCTVALTD